MADEKLMEVARKAAEIIDALATSELGDVGFASQIYKHAGALIYRAPRAARSGDVDQPGMAKSWAARVMLMDATGSVEADSMPDALPETEPDTVLPGLRAVGVWAREAAEAFHEGQKVEGLDDLTIDRSINSLRVSLSRNSGKCWWRLPYTVDGTAWTATVRVERAI